MMLLLKPAVMRGFILPSLFFLFLIRLSAQDKPAKLTLGGYMNSMQSSLVESWDGNWLTENLLHNRLNARWYISGSLTAALELRTRLIYGEFLKHIPGYDRLIDPNLSWADLSGFVFREPSFYLHSGIDRAWIEYTAGSWQLRAGRQRINWGQTFAFNPNDIFNNYSFFDIDYVERPGSDALRIQYYTGPSSVAEAGIKVDTLGNITAAGRYKFSLLNYDFQFLAGILDSEDLVAGLGWSGNIKGAGFRGEFSYFHPAQAPLDTSGVLIASLGFDYTFTNSIFTQAEVLFNGASTPESSFTDYYYKPLTVKTLSFTRWSVLFKISYPFTPLLNGGLSLMAFPGMNGFYLGPDLSVSLEDNLTASLAIQYFNAEFVKGTREQIGIGFLRVSYSF